MVIKNKVIRGEIGCFIAFGHWPYHSAYGGVLEKVILGPEADFDKNYDTALREYKSGGEDLAKEAIGNYRATYKK